MPSKFPTHLITLNSLQKCHFHPCVRPYFWSTSTENSLKVFFYTFHLTFVLPIFFLNQLQLSFYHTIPIKLIGERSPMAMALNYFNLTLKAFDTRFLLPSWITLHLASWYHSVLAVLLFHWLFLLCLLCWFLLILLTVILCKLLHPSEFPHP